MDHIEQFSPFKLNDDQKIAAGLIEQFIDSADDKVFILKGHAGTGKTTLIDALVKYLTHRQIPVKLMATTGRASLIVSEKTNTECSTVHREIYHMIIDTQPGDKTDFKIRFELNINFDPASTVYIVDESSMLSDHTTGNEYLTFGTGRLLSDLFQYLGQAKVIFVGDAAQLPPVNTLFSPAMSKQYIETNHHRFTNEFQLETAMRFDSRSGIGYNTAQLRERIYNKLEGNPQVDVTRFADVHSYPIVQLMTEDYAARYKKYGADNQIFVCHTNEMANELNQRIRADLQLRNQLLAPGEWLVVVQNNYLYGFNNGDHVEMIEMGTLEEKRGTLSYREVTLRHPDKNGGQLFKATIVTNLLNLPTPGLTADQEKEIHKDFAVRMAKEGINPKKDPEKFSERLVADKYVNALKVKYGYAVTAHKAQGGEWPDVYVVVERSLASSAVKDSMNRWIYTAISRAQQRLHLLEDIYMI